MRILVFNVTGQKLQPDKNCDFTGIVAGSKGYLSARFNFSKDWIGCKKVAVFIGANGECPVGLINNTCEIPAEALTSGAVRVYVIGRRPGFEISTDRTMFTQNTYR